MVLPRLLIAAITLLALVPTDMVEAQRNDRAFFTLFDEIALAIQSNRVPGRDPFALSLEETEAALVAPLNLLLASHIASFPLTSVIAVQEVFVRVSPSVSGDALYVRREPLGPLYAETAQTLGQGNFDVGVNTSFFSVSRLRGRDLNELLFTFAPPNLGCPVDVQNCTAERGDIIEERETLEIAVNVEADVQLFVLLGAYSPTPRLDIGIAVPVVRIDLRVHGRAQLSQDARLEPSNPIGEAIYFFNDNALDPVLTRNAEVDPDPVTGLGDVSVRLKYRLGNVFLGRQRSSFNTALLADVRLPTGKKADFLGTGHPNVRLLFIADYQAISLSPHLNLGYQYRGAENDSDEIEFATGLNLKLVNSLDLLLDLLGEFDISSNPPLDKLTEMEDVTFIDVRRSNIPRWGHDHSLLLSTGFKYAPTEQVTFLANLLVPLLPDHGLTYRVAPTVGFFVNF